MALPDYTIRLFQKALEKAAGTLERIPEFSKNKTLGALTSKNINILEAFNNEVNMDSDLYRMEESAEADCSVSEMMAAANKAVDSICQGIKPSIGIDNLDIQENNANILDVMQADYADVSSEYAGAEADFQDAQSVVNTNSSLVNQEQGNVSNAQSEVNSAQTTVNSDQSNVNSAQSTVDSDQAAVNNDQTKTDSASQAVNTSQQEVDTNQNKVQEATTSSEQAAQETSNAEQEVQNTQSAVSSAESEVSSAQSAVQAAQQAVQNAQSKASGSDSEKNQAAVQSAVNSANSQLQQAQERLTQAQQKLTEAQQKQQEAQQKLTEAQQKQQEAQQKLTEAQQSLQTSQTNLQENQTKLTEAQDKLNQSKETLQASQETLNQTQETLKTSQDKLNTAADGLNEAQNTLQKAKDSLQTSKTEKTESEKKVKNAAEKKEVLESVEKNIQNLEQSTVDNKINATHEEINALQGKLNAQNLHIDITGIGTSSTFDSHINDIKSDNVVQTLDEYKKIGKESLTKAICDEYNMNGEEKQKSLSHIQSQLAQKANQLGVETTDLDKKFTTANKNIDGHFVNDENIDAVDKIYAEYGQRINTAKELIKACNSTDGNSNTTLSLNEYKKFAKVANVSGEDLYGNGKFDHASKQLNGNCWLQASINSMTATEAGANKVNNLVHRENNVTTVNIPEAAQKNGKNNGTYSYNNEQLQNLILDESIGDGDMTALCGAVSEYLGTSKGNSIYRGYELISAQKAKIYNNSEEVPMGVGYGKVNSKMYDSMNKTLNNGNGAFSVAFNDNTNFESLNAKTNDGSSPFLSSGHQYAVMAMNNNYITLKESNNPNTLIKIPRNEFINNCYIGSYRWL